ncbi:ATP-binding protein [Streptomyces sp. ODS28]|uniref:ATP-binding protein n=1 Tax=Streptomyces sp. ODS28 TaxID=3136688 RepID=UPI0031EF5D36
MSLRETPLDFPPPQFHVELLVGDHSPCFMRKAARHYLAIWHREALADAVTLALTELLTNVHRHVPGRWCTSTVLRTPHGVRIEVYDRSPTLPEPRTTDPLATEGRGLTLLTHVTSAWGVTPHHDKGKTVWCEVTEVPA